MSGNLRIRPLILHSQDHKKISEWFSHEWPIYAGPTAESAYDKITQDTLSITNKSCFVRWVAHLDSALIGTIALTEDDGLEGYQHYTPWVSGLYIASSVRSQGYGQKLLKLAAQQAQNHHISKLYLYTPNHQEWYQRLGWEMLEKAYYHGYPVSLMQYNNL